MSSQSIDSDQKSVALGTPGRLRRIGAGSSQAIAAILGIRPTPPRVDANNGVARVAWSCGLAINAGVALVFAALAANASRLGYDDWALGAFALSVAQMFLPVAARLMLPQVSRLERIIDLAIVALGLFALRVIREPIYFIGHDEYLHWVTAQHILESAQLFTPSVLFPVGPSFPGLEIVTTAIASLAGVSVFAASIAVLGAARAVFVGALFLVYERVTGSSRVAALGSIFYMGASTFVFFDTYFSYEKSRLGIAGPGASSRSENRRGSRAHASLAPCVVRDHRLRVVDDPSSDGLCSCRNHVGGSRARGVQSRPAARSCLASDHCRLFDCRSARVVEGHGRSGQRLSGTDVRNRFE